MKNQHTAAFGLLAADWGPNQLFKNMTRKNRLSLVADIIEQNCVTNQDELLKLLAAQGFIVTQATLSRDLKKLQAVKVPDEYGSYRYRISDSSYINNSEIPDFARRPHGRNYHPGVEKLAISGNMIVIKTRNGYAGALAYDIDMLDNDMLLGTIAGADTVFAVMDPEADRNEILDVLSAIIPIENMSPAKDQL